MEENKDRRTLWVVVAVIVALLCGCCVGALLGGMLGYATGARSGARSQSIPTLPRATVVPELPWSRQPERAPSTTGALGAVVVEITPNSPAEDAGIRRGDIILAVNGQGLSSEATLAKRIGALSPGDKATLLLVRQGRQRTVTVKVGRKPDSQGNVAWLGLTYQEVSFEGPEMWGGSSLD